MFVVPNYINHPLDAASYLADYELDHETIMAAILHDVVEDTNIRLEDLEKLFGKKAKLFFSFYLKFFLY